MWLVWCSGNSVGDINKVMLSRAQLAQGLMTTLTGLPSRYISRPLNLAIPSRVGAMSTGDGYGHCWGRNGEFCVAVGPVTRPSGILAYCMIVLIRSKNHFQLKGQKKLAPLQYTSRKSSF